MKYLFFLLILGPLALAAPLRADVTSAGQQGLRGLWQIPEALPDPVLSSRVSLGIDYTQSNSLIYAGDNSRQLRRFANVSLVPYENFEFAYQYRALDTRSAYNVPGEIHVRGDAILSAKWSKAVDDWAFGGVGQVTRFIGGGGSTYAGSLIGQYTWQYWDFLAQAGYMVESANATAPAPVKSYAYQQAQRNAVLARAAVSFQGDNIRPFLEYATEQYFAGVASPHRLTLGAHAKAGLEGLVATPMVSIGTSGKETSEFPQEPAWRTGILLSYAVPTDKLYAKLFPPPGSFIASITDATAGSPVSGLVLEWNGRQQDAPDGRFVHQGSTGTYVLTLKADGYLPVSDTVRVEPNQLILKSYGMQRNVGSVRGTVYLGSTPGKASLVVAGQPAAFEANDAGLFGFELAPGAYAMTTTAPGYQPARRTFLVKYQSKVVFDRLELLPMPKPAPKAPTPVTAPSETPPPAPVVSEPPPLVAEAPPEPVKPPEPPPAAEKPAVAKAAPPAPEPVKLPEAPPAPPPAPVAVAAVKPPPKAAPVEAEVVHERERQEWLPQGTGPLPESMESPVFFEFGSWEIDPRGLLALDRLAELLKSDESIQRVVVEGRADAIGSVQINSKIAAERADAIYRYLVSKGVERSKMATMSSYYRRKAVGQSDSVRALDRRVGFRIERE